MIANHIWQSTLFACAVALLAVALRKNRAQVRYWLWLAASVKFLIPFSLLVSIGDQFEWRTAPAVAPPISAAIEQISQPFALPISGTTATTPLVAPALLASLWACGFAAVLTLWWTRWRRIRAAVRAASPVTLDAPIRVMSSPTLLEPGVFGVFRPVLLIPDGIAGRLTPAQLNAILAHEFCHVRRRDNLAAAVHMLVEAIFWFHPLVWWIGARLIEERERACDEEVLLLGNEPQTYAAGILNVCRFYLESPLPCASGVTGADLRKRIEAIMANRILPRLTFARKLLLAGAAMTAVAGPILIGMNSPPQATAPLKFEVASIRPANPSDAGKARLDLLPGGGLRIMNVSLKHLITFAYQFHDFQISGGPRWIESERYDILAKPERFDTATGSHAVRLRTQSLLAERFQLLFHKESKEGPIVALVLAKNGPKIQPSKQAEEIPPGTMRSRTQINARRGTMHMLAAVLSNWLGRPVLDQTGLTGNYDYVLTYAPDTAETNPSVPSGPSMYVALQEQLGLKLESRKGPLEIMVIDRVEKPSEN